MKKFTKILLAFTASAILAGGAYIAVDKIVDNSVKETQKPSEKPPADDPVTITYKATFIYGDIEKVQNVVAGECPKIEAFVSDGTSKFLGWYIGDELIEDPWSYPITQDTIFVAKFEEPVNVSFEGYEDESQLIYVGEYAMLPEDPEKEGYVFMGWSLDGQTIVDVTTTPITEDTHFIAIFEEATTSASLFSFDESGNVTSYSGEETEILIPKTYSLGEVETVTNSYTSYLILNSSEKSYPFTITDSDNATFEITAYSDFTSVRYSIKFPVTVTKNVQKFVNGRDYSVTGIKANAFKSNTTLTSVVIPEGVTTIASYAFNGCTNLTSVEVPDSVTSICATSFNGCTNFKFNKTSETDVGNYVGNANNPYVVLLSLDSKTFTTFTIPENCKYIISNAFNGCTSLTSISIPEGITTLGSSTFKGCTSLKTVTLPSTLTTINGYAFQNCTALEIISIPDSVTTIGTYLFDGCSALTSVTLPNTLTAVPGYMFQNCTNLTEINLPSGIEEITTYAFAGCTNLTEITLPNSLKIIGNSAFLSSGITNIEIPEGVTIIEDNAFSGCGNLTQIVIPDSVVTIKGGVFANCSNLTEIIIGKNVTEIGMDTFPQSSALKVYLNCDKVPTLIKGNSSILAKFYVKDELYDEYIAAEVWSDISTQIYKQSEEA